MKKNVLIFHYSKDYGGGDVFLENIIPALAEKYNILLATVYPERVTANLPPGTPNIKVCRIPVKKPYLLFGAMQFIRIIKENQVDLIFAQDIALSIYARFFQLIFHRLRHLVIINANYKQLSYRIPLTRLLIYWINRWTKSLVNKYICISEYLANELRADGVSQEKIEVIYHGIPLSGEIIERPVHTPVRVAYVGRLTQEKGIDTFIELVKLAIKERLQAEFHIFGTGKYSSQIVALQKEFPDKVIYHGFVKQPLKQGQVDLVVIPSRSEGLSLVALSAFDLGLPVIASTAGGLRDIIKNKENGMLCEEGTADSFLKALIDLLRDDVLYYKIKKDAKDQSKIRFDLKNEQRKYLQLFNLIIP